MSEFASVALVAIFSSNVVAVSGIGAISLQSEKRNFLYMLVSSMCIIVSVIIAGLAYFTVNEYILAPLNAEELKLFVVMLLRKKLWLANSNSRLHWNNDSCRFRARLFNGYV